MIFEALAIAMATFYLWMLASQLDTPIIRPVQKWLRRGWRASWTGCPYCFGFYFAIIITVIAQWNRLDWVLTPLTAIAAAGIVGFVGSFTPGMEFEDEE